MSFQIPKIGSGGPHVASASYISRKYIKKSFMRKRFKEPEVRT